jgi:hypothetical protein
MKKIIKLTLASALTFCLCTTIFAADGTRNTTNPGNWSAAGSWVGGNIASGSGSTAYFTNEITATRATIMDANTTIGNITVNDGDGTANNNDIEAGDGVLTLAGGSTIDCATRLNLKCVVAGTEGFTKTGAGILNIGATSNIISGTVNLRGTGTVILNDKDALMNADVIVDALVNSRKYECNAKSITVNADGIFNVLDTTTYTVPVKIIAESINVNSNGLLGAGLDASNTAGQSFELLSPSVNINHGGKIRIQGSPVLITIGGSNINVIGSGSVSNGGMISVQIPLVTNTAPLKVAGYAANNLGALRALSNSTFVVDADVELTGNTRFGGKGKIVMNKNITGTGNLDLEVNGTPAEEFICRMYGNNSYNGSTTIRAECGRISRLVLESPNALPGNQLLIMHASNTASYSFYTTAKLNVRGQDGTVGNLRLTGDNQKMIYDYLAGWNGSLTVTNTMEVLAGYAILSNTVMIVNGDTDFHTNLYVHSAKLILNGNIGASLSPGAMPIILQANSTIGGIGYCGKINIPGGSTISPGESIGVLYPKDIEMEAGSFYDWEIGDTTAGESDEVKCSQLTLPSAANSITVRVLKTTGPTMVGDTNELFITTGIIGGSAASIVLDYSGTFISGPENPSIDNNNIIITGLTPEPGCIGLFLLSGLAWLRLKR